jgi:hypothetical protein
MRKHTPRRVWIPQPPPGLRPKLDRGQQTDLALAHLTNLDLVATGQADETVMWHLCEQALLWSRVAQCTGQLQEEMHTQLMVAANVVRRFGRTGRVGFSGEEYQAAKEGIAVMDALSAGVDRLVAVAAADWAERQIDLVRVGAVVLPDAPRLEQTTPTTS